ncbi:28801_t:CDS:1 [Racocetra persica]|uniref:28801_t:CDS:1 n=1 Tax=Racocetra persica TaxID=160502 RepID=A0ACA9M0C0_9GLOM|nr:28801_t:CDS:1 [Racocetra persica]
MANNQHNQIANLSQIIISNNLHQLDPKDVQVFALSWNKPQTMSGYDALELKITPICKNTLNIINLEIIEQIAHYIWEYFTTLEEQDIHTNIAFRVNEYKRANCNIFGPQAPGLLRHRGVEKTEPEDLSMRPIEHTDESDALFHGCDFP